MHQTFKRSLVILLAVAANAAFAQSNGGPGSAGSNGGTGSGGNDSMQTQRQHSNSKPMNNMTNDANAPSDAASSPKMMKHKGMKSGSQTTAPPNSGSGKGTGTPGTGDTGAH